MKLSLIALLALISSDVFARPMLNCESNQMKLTIRIEQQVVRKTAIVWDVEDGNERMIHNEYLIASGGAYNNLTTGGYVVPSRNG